MFKRTFDLIFLKVLLISMFTTSCVHASNVDADDSKYNTPLDRARDAFVMLETSVIANICDELTKSCHSESIPLVFGSGFVIEHSDIQGSYVATAAHVCEPQKLPNKFTSKGLSITAGLEVSAITKERKKFTTKVIRMDKKGDLCLLYAKDLERPKLKIAAHAPRPGDRILNVAAPAGILHKNAPFITDGFFNGYDPEANLSVYSLPVTGGSSGSAIMNQRGEVVGLVSMMNTRFNFIVYSPSYDSLRRFYEREVWDHRELLLRRDFLN